MTRPPWLDPRAGMLVGAWALLPFTVGEALADTTSSWSSATGVAVAAWTGWAIVAVTLMVPRAATLTVVRVAAPVPLAVAAAASGADLAPLALAHAAALAAMAADPAVGARHQAGSAYGSEVRESLRAPPAMWLGPIPLGWALTVIAISAGPLALADHRWWTGTILTAVGWPLAGVVGRSLHLMARRWIVFVPAGLVIHDPVTLADPVLFQRPVVASMAPAGADSDALDLTAGAPGLALEVALRESVPMVLANTGWRRRTPGQTGRVSRLLVTPTRPGRVLHEARRRRLPVTLETPAPAPS